MPPPATRATIRTSSTRSVNAYIDKHYAYSPTRFSNGMGDDIAISEAGQNEGSCKIFALGQMLQLTEQETLHCFGDYYRQDVLQHPEGSDHANIRNFIKYGWQGIQFDGSPLLAIE